MGTVTWLCPLATAAHLFCQHSTLRWLIPTPLHRVGVSGVSPDPPFRTEGYILPAAGSVHGCWRTAQSLSGNHPRLNVAFSSKAVPHSWVRSAFNHWPMRGGYKAPIPSPRLKITLKGHPNSRAPHGVGWGVCIPVQRLFYPGLLPSVPHRSISLEQASMNFQHISPVSWEPDLRHTHLKYKAAFGRVRKIILQVYLI